MKGRNPTDLEILEAIFDRHYDDFVSFKKGDGTRASKIHVPIDIRKIADDLGVDGDIIFGRLYYDLEKRFGYEYADGKKVRLFSMETGGDRNTLNFPYASSILAQLRDERSQYLTAKNVSLLSIGIALVSLFVSLAS